MRFKPNSQFYLPLSAHRERGLYVGIHTCHSLFIIGHPIDEIVWITLTPTLSLRELTGVGIHPHPNPLPEGEGVC